MRKSANGNSNYFATMVGSKTLSMLASFSHGREIIKLLLKSKATTFSIFSHPRPIRWEPGEINDRHISRETENTPTVLRTLEKPTPSERHGVVSYRNSPKIIEVVKGRYFSIARNENVLTVLIDVSSYDLYTLMFNRMLFDAKKIGPGCMSALVDAILYLQEKGNIGTYKPILKHNCI